MIRLLLLALLLVPLASTAQIYKTTDKHGNVSYSDTPPPDGGAEEVKLRETNSAPPPEMQEPRGGTAEAEPAAAGHSLTITSPANETTFPMGPGDFSVSVAVEPPLAGGALLQLYIDGVPSGMPQSGTSWSLTNVLRGAHDLTVAVTDGGGATMAESGPVRVYVLRPSLNSPARPQPPRPTPR